MISSADEDRGTSVVDVDRSKDDETQVGNVLLSQLKKSRALNETPSHSYGVSLVIWDHSVLPATRHK